MSIILCVSCSLIQILLLSSKFLILNIVKLVIVLRNYYYVIPLLHKVVAYCAAVWTSLVVLYCGRAVGQTTGMSWRVDTALSFFMRI